MSGTLSDTSGLRNLPQDNIILSTLNATDLTDNTLITRDICKPGETISALIRPVDSFNPSDIQTFSNPLRGKLVTLKQTNDAYRVFTADLASGLAERITRLEEDAKQRDAGFERLVGQLVESARGEVQEAVDKAQEAVKKVQEAVDKAQEAEKKVRELTLIVEQQMGKMEDIEKRLKGKDDEAAELKDQYDDMKNQHDTTQRELDGMKERLLDLQATSDDTVDWMSGNDTILLDRIRLRNLITLAQSRLATAAQLSDRNSVQQTSDAWRQRICYNDLSIDDRLALVHSLLPNLTLSDIHLRLVVAHLSDLRNRGNAVAHALTRDRRVYQGATERMFDL
ncbi:hypothetical protein FIBSPDRAFT_924015 [Athelia psychrophila]|uniref:Uncharacterized protein n=1 Tax=Athelia psychrophila TaxID=1759441 RepID=A0A166X7W1_9AGAM|nr:hypothetical protein FIBSPDRAFT_924015 [Fibularhizoctonia sp. CBS 109695]